MNTNKAILLIEFQKQWTWNFIHNFFIKKQLKSKKVLENSKKLVEESRKKWFKIVHAPIIIDPKNKKWLFAKLTFWLFFTKWKENSELTEWFFEKWDIIVKWRYTFDAFTWSDLETILKKNNLKEIYVCWFTTDQCVSKTLKTLIKKWYNWFLVSNCTATLNSFLQKRIENKFKNNTIESKIIYN